MTREVVRTVDVPITQEVVVEKVVERVVHESVPVHREEHVTVPIYSQEFVNVRTFSHPHLSATPSALPFPSTRARLDEFMGCVWEMHHHCFQRLG